MSDVVPRRGLGILEYVDDVFLLGHAVYPCKLIAVGIPG
jgi:hypothetical protein